MKKRKLWKSMVSITMSAAILLSSAATYAQTEQTVEDSIAVTAEADEDGFVIEDGVLIEYTGTATEVVIPNNVTSIGDRAFNYCSSLEKVTIPEGVTSIGEFAFNYCSSLTEVTIPDSVISIGYGAFMSCSSLEEVTIPRNVTSIGYGAFMYCSSLININVSSENSIYTSVDGCVYTKDKTTVLICPGGKTTKVDISGDVTNIADDAFFGCSSLTDINVSSGNSIYASVDGCVYTKDKTTILICPGGKTKVDIPDGVTSIGDSAFWCCESLKEVTIPNSVTNIEGGAFAWCSSLTEVTIPDSVTSIGNSAFLDCYSLIEVTLPKSVTKMGSFAFGDCIRLKKVTILGNITSIGYGAFYDCENLEEVIISGSVTSIGDTAFYSCISLEKVTIPASVTSIGDEAFYGCHNLIIYGKADSYAETYAKENNIPFCDFEIDEAQTNTTYEKGSTEAATIKCSGELADFLNIYVDGILVDKKDYELKEGSTIIIFTQAFMDTLGAGDHIFTLEYTEDRKVEVSMTVTAPAVGGIIGDADGDGKVDAADALEILKYVAELIELDENALKLANVNADTNVDAADALDILKKVAELIDKFEAETEE